MRCSFFEVRLDAYLEGTLLPAQTALLEGHVQRCASCAGLLAELRAIDALLVTARELEPAANFTFRVMAEVRDVPAPRHHRTPVLAVGAAYLAFAWVAIASFFAFGGKAAPAALAFVSGLASQFGGSFAALGAATSHLFGGATVGVTATMSAILIADGLLGVAAILAYGAVARGRFGRQSARSTEAS